jgi:GR25 family glycosyltransferase involved in LPS biosynthesis
MFDKVRPLLTSNSLSKSKEIINKDTNKDSNKVEIIITFTTCKRLDLFKQTVNSILNHWTDINKIDYWFCVDDNSCENDKKEMTNIYPWINYYMKSNDEKGHRQSMNIIWNKLNELKPVYWIHMEDDFLFHYKTNYIEQAIDGLKCNDVKQILFNRNYGEIIDSYNTKGHINATNTTNIVLHNHFINNCNYINCHYWPHYSFRPSLTETKTILELGNFDSKNQFFEMDYAKKWTASGHKSGFFNRITCRHIGRLTSDRNTKIVKNAYDLNNEAQFSPVTNLEEDIAKFSENKIKIINLERRPDRKAETIQKLLDARFEPDEYEFINAVDGSTLEPTLFIKNLFAGNDFGNRKGFIGCALTHYNLWQQLANDSTNTYYVIMEDDFTLSADFKDRLDTLNQNGELLKKELLFLGYHMFEKDRKLNFDIYNNTIETVKIVPLNTNVYIGGTFAYSINKKGATKMLDYIKTNGIKHGIDYLIKLNTGLHGYECQPQIVFSEWNENGAKIDSDIQNIYDRLDFSNISENLESYFTFIPNLDIIGNDIYYHNKTIQEQMTIAYNDNECIGFNTLGFFKNTKVNDISNLKPSQYFKDGDGFYIKTHHLTKNKTNTIKIKMLCNWTSS